MEIGYRQLLPQHLRRLLQSLMVECGTAGCRRFHLAHPLLPRLPGIFLDRVWYCSPGCFRDAVKQRVETQLGQAITDLRHPPRMPFRLILLSAGKVTQEQLARARSAEESGGKQQGDLGDALVRLGYVTEEVLAAARAAESACLFFSGALHPLASAYSLPASLMRAYRAAPVHHSPLTDRLLIGFVYRINHPLLQAVEQVTGCRAEPCIITAAAWKQQMAGCGAAGLAEVNKRAIHQSRIVNLVVEQAIESRADRVRMGLSSTAIWARLAGGPHGCDLVIDLASGGAAASEDLLEERVGHASAAYRA